MAGLCYLVIIGLGIVQSAFISSVLVVPGDRAATAANLAEHDLLYRVGVLGDVALYTLVLILAVALYLILRGVHQPLAMGALVLRLAAAAVVVAVVRTALEDRTLQQELPGYREYAERVPFRLIPGIY